jgi:hypothetical protein
MLQRAQSQARTVASKAGFATDESPPAAVAGAEPQATPPTEAVGEKPETSPKKSREAKSKD